MLMSQSQLELYLDCPFKYACEKILRLGDSSPAEFSYAGIGTYVHAILERYLKEIYTVRGGVYPPEQDNRALLASVSESVIDEIAPPGTPSRTGLVSHLSERLRLLAAVISDDVSKEIRGSDFLPEHFELEIGPGKFPPISFPLSDGGSVSFIGKVDRIDVCRRDGVAYIKAVDYKTGSKEFRVSDIADGKNLQLLLYMLSLTKDGNSSFFGGKPKEAAFEYLSCNAERLKELPETEAEAVNKASETLSRSGIVVEGNECRLSGNNENRYLMKTSKSSSTVTEEEFKEFKDTVSGIITDTAEKMKSGYAAARPSNGSDSCRYCSYSGICRSSVKYDGINETED
ncbi:MAG: PD-(D/E)XK nuclease family protein [Clostridia bacterium]|nr:PD-(D/E)XK nuclease family protein [Clostridia bacterium]